MMRLLIVLAAILAVPAFGFSATYYVPDHFPTIQGAISDVSVVNGDTIIVRDGGYAENINFLGKAITVISENGPGPCMIDGGKVGSVATFNSGEGNDSVLEGFVLINGSGTLIGSDYYGGGVLCDAGSSPTIRNNILPGNSADYGGAIASLADSSPIIVDNQLVGNSATNYGAGAYGDHSNAVMRSNFIAGNSAANGGGGIYYRQDSNPIIEGNTLTGNSVSSTGGTGGAIRLMLSTASAHAVLRNNQIYGNSCSGSGAGVYLDSSSTTILNNTVVYNSAVDVGGGFYITGSATSYHCELRDNIIWGNTANTSDPQIYAASGSGYSVNYCDVQGGWPGTGNIDADPQFIGGPNGSFYLSQIAAGQSVDSPCVDVGSTIVSNVGLENGTTRTDLVPDAGIVDLGYHDGPYSDLTLDAYEYQISLVTGGSIPLTLLAGADNAARNYLILGSVTGTTPGTTLPGGFVVLPVNWDLFSNFVITLINSPVFSDFMGTLDTAGYGTALFDAGTGPLDPTLVGIQMYYAYALNKPWDFASNPVMVEFIP